MKLSMSTNISDQQETNNNNDNTPTRTIAVTGATGRTGRLVISQLLTQYPNYNILALVRDVEKANSIFNTDANVNTSNLKILKCDLMNSSQVSNILSTNKCSQVIWCATGFSNNPNQNVLNRVGTVLKALLDKEGKNSLDSVGLSNLANGISIQDDMVDVDGPNIIMCSSAGVTRPSWSESKKEKYAGCADIPIVRLNPFNILNIKANSEEKLRSTSSDNKNNVSYVIVRPTGLKDGDDWPNTTNARPILSQGDVAVGRIHRKDVADILIQCLHCPEAKYKTFEVFSIAGYQPNVTDGIKSTLKSLKVDGDEVLDDDNVLETTYLAMQQLLPGEKQDASALAMGQTYEELDEGKVGRLGVKGEEKVMDTTLRASD
jgi:nucleoside-diphosphate-sugar epimerase